MAWRPIQTGTAGLLSLLGLKNLGKNPDEILEVVRPSLEMSEFWLRGSSQVSKSEANLAANFENYAPVEWLASEQEWLYIHYGLAWWDAVTNPPAANSGIILRVANAALTTILWQTEFLTPFAPGGGTSAAVAVIEKLWVPPGFGLILSTWATVGDYVAISGMTNRLKV